MTPAGDGRTDGTRGTVVGLLLLAALWALAFAAYRPPAPRGADTPATEFSAVRARDQLSGLLAGSVPHPMGSAANRLVRERILARLHDLGYETELQDDVFECDRYAACGTPVNIVAYRVTPTADSPGILLAAHYDSVPAGPGASDDGAGVAEVLEIARVLRAQPAPAHPIVLLIGDGEEVGLLGAQVFVEHHRWARYLKAAVNVDNRGTSGPALMFETGAANAWLMRLYADTVTHPYTNSLYYTIYKLLPNDTDFTVFKRAGYQGFNFAFIGDAARYHTPLDDIAHMDLRSVQQEGDAALAALRALAGADLDHPPSGDAVYFDLFGAALVRMPQSGMLPLAGLTLVMALVVTAVLATRERGFAKAVALSGTALLATWCAAAALALGALHGLRALSPGGLPAFSATPWTYLLTFAALGALLLSVLASLLRRRIGFWSLWCAHVVLLSALALACALEVPGASYTLLLPAAAAAIATWVHLLRRSSTRAGRDLTVWLYLVAMFTLLWPIIIPLYAGLGVAACPVMTVLLVVGAAPLAGVWRDADRRLTAGLTAVAIAALLGGAAATLRLPAYTSDSPQPFNIRYLLESGASGRPVAHWVLVEHGRQMPPPRMQAVVHFESDRARPDDPFLDFGDAALFTAAAAPADLPQAHCAIESAVVSPGPPHDRVHYRVHVDAPADADSLALAFPAAASLGVVTVAAATANGAAPGAPVPVTIAPRRGGDAWHIVTFVHPATGGYELEFDASRGFDVHLAVRRYGLPADGEALRQARPATMEPIQDGDVRLATRTVHVAPPP